MIRAGSIVLGLTRGIVFAAAYASQGGKSHRFVPHSARRRRLRTIHMPVWLCVARGFRGRLGVRDA